MWKFVNVKDKQDKDTLNIWFINEIREVTQRVHNNVVFVVWRQTLYFEMALRLWANIPVFDNKIYFLRTKPSSIHKQYP